MRKYYFTIILVLLFASVSFGATYRVSQTGNETCTGDYSAAQFNAGGAPFNVLDGDTVELCGTISTVLTVPDSGTSGNELIITNYDTNTLITGGINIGYHEYVIVTGKASDNKLKFQNTSSSWINCNNADHIKIQYIDADGATPWAGITIAGNSNADADGQTDGATYIEVLDSSFEDGAGGPDDLIYIRDYVQRVRIEGNTFGDSLHVSVNNNNTGGWTNRYIVIKNNTVSNTRHTSVSSYSNTQYVVCEGNVAFNSGTMVDGTYTDDAAFQNTGTYQITRKNVAYNTQPPAQRGWGIYAASWGGTYSVSKYARIYNNTIVGNDYGLVAWDTGPVYAVDNVAKNNIFYLNDTALYFPNGTANWTLTNNSNNTTNPQFTDVGSLDFSLQSDSPFINQGTYLTQVNDADGCTSASEVCTSLVVDDAKYFVAPSAQWGVPGAADDYICTSGWATPIQITAVNYSTNTITLSAEPNPGWGNNDNVYLAYSSTVCYYDSAPDMGAYEYTTGGGADTAAPTPNPATFSSNPAADSTSQISMTATTGSDATPPIYYGFLYDPAEDSCNAAGCGTDGGGAGGTSSGYQESDYTYSDSGLDTNNCYCYRTRSKDSVGTPNEGDPSSTVAVYTLADTPEPLTLTDSAVDTTTQILLQAITADNNPDANPTTTYAVYVASSSPNDSTWQGKYVDTDGTPSATAVWQSKAAWANTEIVGLNSNTTFGFQSIAKNGDGILTANSTTAEWATTYPPVSGEDETLVNITFENITINNTP